MISALKRLFAPQSSTVVPMPSIVYGAVSETTPDILLLEQKANHLMFLYCDRQTTHSNSVLADHVWNGFTERRFMLWMRDGLGLPIALSPIKEFRTVPSLPIRGEVVRMSTKELVELDQERGNGVQFKRVREKISIPHEQLTYTKDRSSMEQLHGKPYVRGDFYPLPCTTTIEAWMYVARNKHWADEIDGGYKFKLAKVIHPNKSALHDTSRDYYHIPPC